MAVLLLAGCAGTPAQRMQPVVGWARSPDPALAGCAALYRRLDDAVDAAGVRDGGEARLPGHPHLRTDRFLAGLATAPDADPAVLLPAMHALDARARQFELANLPAGIRASLAPADGRTLAEAVGRCGEVLLSRTDPGAIALARVPDDYDTWKRAAGLYPLTRVPFAFGVRGYQRDTRRTFAVPLEALPVARALVRHGMAGEVGPPPGFEVLAPGAPDDPAARQRWFARFAPVLEIDTVADSDLPGHPEYTAEGQVDVDVTRPVMFTRLAHTRFEGRVLPQLVYSVWFRERPPAGRLDALAGRLDGLTWRVTLGPDGTPWLFDTIHNCGCYHQFFPTPHLRARPPAGGLDESVFVPQTLPALARGDRIVLRIASGTHYLQRVTVAPDPVDASPLEWADDDSLRSLPHPHGGRRSLFGTDGIVAGTERGERWWFWPMGVREPGAMRQWGRHATAFVGRRHFDDPDLLDRNFATDAP